MVAQQQSRTCMGTGVVAAAMAGLMVCVGGCSVGRAGAEDAREGITSVEVLHRAADALERAGSAQTRTSMEMATGGTRVTIRGQGVYDFKKQLGQLKVLLPQDPAGAVE